MNISEKLNRMMPGEEHIGRIQDGGKNPSRLQSIWLGLSLVLVEMPGLLVMNIGFMLMAIATSLWGGITGVALAILTFLQVFALTIMWACTSVVLGFAGKLEGKNVG